MQPNPYSPPKSDVSRKGFEEPSQWRRVKWVFGALWLMLTVLPMLNAFLIPPPSPNMGILLLNSFVALGVAALIARDMWLLKVRRSPLIVDILVYAIALGGFAFLIVLKETKLYVWNSIYLDVPIFMLMGTVAIAAWVTEAKKATRIYFGARNFMFVDAKDGL